MATFAPHPSRPTRRDFLLALPPSLLAWSACTPTPPRVPGRPWAGVEYLCERFVSRERAPSISLAVGRNGRVVFASARGLAGIQRSESAAPDTRYRIASVTKTFVGALFLLLQRAGRLSLDEPASHWLPDFPRSGDFTIRMLLGHTSGLAEYTDRPLDVLARDARRDYSNEEIVAYMASLDPLFVHPPGGDWRYSNTGYVLLGVIAERATGGTLGALMAEHLTGPAGLTETRWDDHPDLAPDRATGYGYRAGRWIPAPPVSVSYIGASGGLRSTASDLCRWYHALFGGEILTDDELGAMLEPVRLADGRSTVRRNGTAYGLGVWTGLLEGRRQAWHAGSTAGFAADARHDLDRGVSIAMLGNADAGRMGSEPRRIREAVRLALEDA